MTKHSIVYGFDKSGYSTSNAAQEHEGSKDAVATSNLSKQRGAQLKKSNFHFGHDGAFQAN